MLHRTIGDHTPETSAEMLVHSFGEATATKLMEHMGGRVTYIPSPATLEREPDHWLNVLLGREEARKVVNHFTVRMNGARLTIPKGQNLDRARSQDIVYDMLRAGASNTAIVRATGCHERTIYRHRARYHREIIRENAAEIASALKRGETVARIADRLKITRPALQLFVDKLKARVSHQRAAA